MQAAADIGSGFAARRSGGTAFSASALGFLALAAALAGWAPIQFSIATVFLFAGPHNWVEFRYFLARLPGRWGRSRGFYALSIGGAGALTATYALLPLAASAAGLTDRGWVACVAAWNTVVVLWVVALALIHARQTKRDWGWAVPVGLALVAAVWAAPYGWSLALVYLHPVVSLCYLDRELRRRPEWRSAYRVCLAAIPLLLLALWWQLGASPDLAASDAVALRVTRHAGAGIVSGVSTHFLVAAHTFLEAAHYGVWLVAMPLLGARVAPRAARAFQLARRSQVSNVAVRLALGASGVVVIALWACFLADYPTTRDVYFTFAMLHVLVEAPFLLRML